MDLIRHKSKPQIAARGKRIRNVRHALAETKDYSILSPDLIDLQLTAAILDTIWPHYNRRYWRAEWLSDRQQWRIAYRIVPSHDKRFEKAYREARRNIQVREKGKHRHQNRQTARNGFGVKKSPAT